MSPKSRRQKEHHLLHLLRSLGTIQHQWKNGPCCCIEAWIPASVLPQIANLKCNCLSGSWQIKKLKPLVKMTLLTKVPLQQLLRRKYPSIISNSDKKTCLNQTFLHWRKGEVHAITSLSESEKSNLPHMYTFWEKY